MSEFRFNKSTPNQNLLLVELRDYACPSFCSGVTAYVGTIDSFAELADAGIKENPESLYFRTIKEAAKKYRQGYHDATIDIGFGERQFAKRLAVLAEAEYTDGERQIEFYNIYECENLLHTEQISASIVYVRTADEYMRCIKVSMKNISLVDEQGVLLPIDDFWGHPEVLYHDGAYIRSRLYAVEKRFADEAECRADIENPSPLSFDSFLFDVFGNG